MGVCRWWRGCGARRRVAALAALAAALVLAAGAGRGGHVRLPRVRRLVPRVPPQALAHRLADFSSHPLADTGAWSVAEESGNYSEWRYGVTFECGARCAGEARVTAATRGADHRVTLRARLCTRPPLLPWPRLCDEWEVRWAVRGAQGAGSELQREASARCAAWGAGRRGAGGCGAELRDSAERHEERALAPS